MIEKNKLAELIDGYAIAKSSGNATLLEMSLGALKEAIDGLYAAEPLQPLLIPDAPELIRPSEGEENSDGE